MLHESKTDSLQIQFFILYTYFLTLAVFYAGVNLRCSDAERSRRPILPNHLFNVFLLILIPARDILWERKKRKTIITVHSRPHGSAAASSFQVSSRGGAEGRRRELSLHELPPRSGHGGSKHNGRPRGKSGQLLGQGSEFHVGQELPGSPCMINNEEQFVNYA